MVESSKISSAWMYTVLPISALSAGLSILIPLYILFLKGTVYDVGVATAVYALVEIPSSIFWGNLTDKIKKTKLFILLSIIGVFPILLILYFISYVPVVYTVYGLYSFVATASSPAINILIMSKKKTRTLPKYFSRYSIIVIIGSLLGLIGGLLINYGMLKQYLLFLLAVNVTALLAAMFLIESDNLPEKIENELAVKRSFSVLNMLSVTPHILTGHALLERLHKGLRNHKRTDIYLLLLMIALFNLGLYLFNTSYIPYLYAYGVNYSGIFSINISNMIAQLIIYTVVMSLVKRIRLGRYYKLSTITRSISYVIAMIPAFIVTQLFLSVNILAYFVAGIGYAMWNITSSVMLYERIKHTYPGHYIGLWVAILGLSGVVGAFMSGIISSIDGYFATFVISIAAIILSLIVLIYMERLWNRRFGVELYE